MGISPILLFTYPLILVCKQSKITNQSALYFIQLPLALQGPPLLLLQVCMCILVYSYYVHQLYCEYIDLIMSRPVYITCGLLSHIADVGM